MDYWFAKNGEVFTVADSDDFTAKGGMLYDVDYVRDLVEHVINITTDAVTHKDIAGDDSGIGSELKISRRSVKGFSSDNT